MSNASARSSEAKGRRIGDGVSSLVDTLISPARDKEGNIIDERHGRGIKLVKRILEGHKSLAVVPDADHISDLIKTKLLREYDSSEKAVHFSNIYARLRTQKVLSQKWGILYLLHQMAAPDPGDDGSSSSPTSSIDGDPTPQTAVRRPEDNSLDFVPSNSRELSPPAGLPRLPSSYRRGSTESAQTRVLTERVIRRNSEQVQDAPQELSSREIDAPEAIPTEAALLRDLPFTLQGLSTTHLPFTSSSQLKIPPRLPLPLVSLLHALAEPSLLYRSLSESVQAPVEGLIAQSLTSAIGNELRSYLAFIATLEGEIRRSVTNLDGQSCRGNVGKVGVTLKRCVVWTREATMGLRLMSVMVERAKSRKGGRLVSMVHALSSSHGDPFVAAFAERIMVHVTKPFYDMLRQWIYDGELSDPYHELFVTEQEPRKGDQGKTNSQRAPAINEWEDRYKLDHGMVPTVMTQDLSEKAFLIGKSLNFLRHGCGDSAWVEAYCKGATKELHYGDTATLETSIDKAYKATMSRLTHLMQSKFHLFEHLHALKKYLLLGQGDFVALLIESLASTLDRPAGTQYRHTLTGLLETAIRGSNAQYDTDEVLHRLDAKILELSHGDIGWDVFALEYKVDAPVNVIITPWASRKYLAMFNFLWRVKRVEFSMGSTWRRSMTGARGVLADLDDKMSRDWKAARCCMAEMIHFVNQLQYYILFEVIEASWDQLQAAITKPDCTLDGLIEAHSRYLDNITHKGLFGTPRHPVTGNLEDGLPNQLHCILKNMLKYRDAVDGLYSFSVAEFTRQQQRTAQGQTRAASLGNAGAMYRPNEATEKGPRRAHLPIKERADSPFPANDILKGASPGESEDQMLSALRVRLGELSDDFRTRITTFLGDLASQPDIYMRFLGVVMNFNNVYRPRRRRRELNRKEDGKTLDPGAPAGSKGTVEEGDGDVEGDGGSEGENGGAVGNSRYVSRSGSEKRKGKEGDVRRENGKSGATKNPRVPSRQASKLKEEERDRKEGDGGSLGEKRGSTGHSRVVSRAAIRLKEEKREGNEGVEQSEGAKKGMTGISRVVSRPVSMHKEEKREGTEGDENSEGEKRGAARHSRVVSRSAIRHKEEKRDGVKQGEDGNGGAAKPSRVVSRPAVRHKEEKREGDGGDEYGNGGATEDPKVVSRPIIKHKEEKRGDDGEGKDGNDGATEKTSKAVVVSRPATKHPEEKEKEKQQAKEQNLEGDEISTRRKERRRDRDKVVDE